MTTVADVMTRDPATVDLEQTAADAARLMVDNDAGAVIVMNNGTLYGIVTDRDIAVRLVAEEKPASTPVADIVSDTDLMVIGPDTSIEQAVQLMRGKSVRRLPVVQDGRAVGIVSLGDLAKEADQDSALADISAADGNV